MPRYFFHIADGDAFHDEEGTDLPDALAARKEGTRVAAAWLRDHPNDIWADGDLTVTVQDHRGLTLFLVTVSGHASAATQGTNYGPEDYLVR